MATRPDPGRERRLLLPDHADPSRRLIVEHVSLANFRSYARLDLELGPGLVLVTGPNGVGKTNLLEALHVGVQGFSPRTRADNQLVRLGERAARVGLAGASGRVPVETEVTIRLGEGKRVAMNGAALASAEELRTRLAALVFSPDRLAIVKGGPIVRRAYFDRMLGRVRPADGDLASDYARALAQRNAALRGVRGGWSGRETVVPWTRAVAELGGRLDAARAELVALMAPGFAAAAALLGLEAGALGYEERGLTVEELDTRLERDIERATTSAGPHLRDVVVSAAARDLRSFGSQGEQRTAVLALVLAEARLLAERRGVPPALLLDDVLSELDEPRRAALLRALPPESQTVVTTTSPALLPAQAPAPALVVEVAPGRASRAG